jgi:hypothetical protein
MSIMANGIRFIERAIIRQLVEALAVAGFHPVKFYDSLHTPGGDYQKIAPADSLDGIQRHCIEAFETTDGGTLHFAPVGRPKDWGAFGVMLVGGNGVDVISDWHSGNPHFNAAMERVSEWVTQEMDA